VRTGQRVIVQQVASGALRGLAQKVGASLTRRVAGTAATRWVPLAGAAAVSAYAYWDTLQVAKTAHKLLSAPADPESE
jgi:hypothetical protein